MADDGFDLQSDPANCGRCGGSCSFVHAFPACQAGQCALGACFEGYADADRQPGNGCECLYTNGRVEICDGADNDCDGSIDEDFDFASDLRHCGGCFKTCSYLPGGLHLRRRDLRHGGLQRRLPRPQPGGAATAANTAARPATAGSRSATARTTTATAPSIGTPTDAGAACGGMPGGTGECRQGSRMCINGSLRLRGRGDARHRGVRRQGQRLRRRHRRGGSLPGDRLLPGGRHRLRRQRRDLQRPLPAGELGLHHRPSRLPGHGRPPSTRSATTRTTTATATATKASTSRTTPASAAGAARAANTPTPSPSARAGPASAAPATWGGPTPTATPPTAANTSAAARASRSATAGTTTATAHRRRRPRPAVPRHQLLLAAGRMRQGPRRLHPLRQRRQLSGLRHRGGGQPPGLDLQLPGHGGDRRGQPQPDRDPGRHLRHQGQRLRRGQRRAHNQPARHELRGERRHRGVPAQRHLPLPGQHPRRHGLRLHRRPNAHPRARDLRWPGQRL